MPCILCPIPSIHHLRRAPTATVHSRTHRYVKYCPAREQEKGLYDGKGKKRKEEEVHKVVDKGHEGKRLRDFATHSHPGMTNFHDRKDQRPQTGISP